MCVCVRFVYWNEEEQKAGLCIMIFDLASGCQDEDEKEWCEAGWSLRYS